MDTSKEIIEEENLNDYPDIITSENTEIILSQMKKNICKIYMDDGSKGTGFFCKIPIPNKNHFIKVLVTNNHLIDENHIKKENIIIFTINNDKRLYKLNIDKRKVYTSKKYDTTIIEIYEDKDNIHDFLEIDFDINQEFFNNIYKNKSIYILQYPKNERVSVSYGIIKDINLLNNFDFRHLCCTEKGSSGSPILNLSNNKIIGIHKGTHNNHNYNKGTLLIYPFKDFISQIKNEINLSINNNIIKNESFLDINKGNNIPVNFQNKIEKNFINYLNDNLNKYINKRLSKYNNLNNKDYKDNNEIEQIIINENIDEYYKKIIHESLSKYTKIQNSIKLKKISIIVTGRSGVGKSVLIICLLKLEGKNSVWYQQKKLATLETKKYKSENIPFLTLTDTKGYEDNEKYCPENISNEILNIIQFKEEKNFFEEIWEYIKGNEKKDKKDFNDSYHCIWFCVNGDRINEDEKNALRKLKNNNQKIPIIVVFTYALISSDIKSMENQIKQEFPDLQFIDVLARNIPGINQYGLDDLLNLTINTIKSMEENDIFKAVINEYKLKESELTQNIISEIKVDIINKLLEEFMSNFTNFLNENDFEKYIFSLIEKLITAFSFKKEISQKTKLILQKGNTKNYIQSYIVLCQKLTKNFMNDILQDKSLEYLDMELLYKFCKDNFDFVAQKYFIYRLIKDLLKAFAEKLGKKILAKIDIFLKSNEIMDDYRKIYLKIFEVFEEYINKFKDKNGKIYN